jgi:hypothetical protein
MGGGLNATTLGIKKRGVIMKNYFTLVICFFIFLFGCQKEDTTRIIRLPNNIKNPTIVWSEGSEFGIVNNGHGLGIIKGSGKLDHEICGAHIKGDAKADGNGGVIYSNVTTGTTTSEYWDGARNWNVGAILGITDNGKSIGVLKGSGKLEFNICGAKVIGDVVADGEGGLIYSNIINGKTTSEYTDEVGIWKPGAAIGVVNDGKDIGILNGIRKTESK